MAADPAPPPTGSPTSYGYKPALFGDVWRFDLTPDAIVWAAGARRGSLAYVDIRRLRLSFRPVSTQTHRFIAEIWPVRGGKLQLASSSWRSMVDQERHDAAYSCFVLELHRRLAAARVNASFECGSSALRYWPGLVVSAGVALALAALLVRALQAAAGAGAVLVGGVLAVFVWQAAMFFRRNRPGSYRPEMPPRDLLP